MRFFINMLICCWKLLLFFGNTIDYKRILTTISQSRSKVGLDGIPPQRPALSFQSEFLVKMVKSMYELIYTLMK